MATHREAGGGNGLFLAPVGNEPRMSVTAGCTQAAGSSASAALSPGEKAESWDSVASWAGAA